MASLIQPSACGFIRGAVHLLNNHKPLFALEEQPGESLEEKKERELANNTIANQNQRERLEELKRHYPFVTVDFKTYSKVAFKFKNKCKDWTKHDAEKKREYMNFFHPKKWVKLSADAKSQHTWTNCKPCGEKHQDMQMLFPQRKMDKISNKAQNYVVGPFSSEATKQRATLDFYNNANTLYQEAYGESLAQGLVKVSELKLQHAKTNKEKKIEEKSLVHKVAKSMEDQIKATALEKCLGNRQSFAAWERNRLASGFEPIPDAKTRSESKKKLVVSGLSKGSCWQP